MNGYGAKMGLVLSYQLPKQLHWEPVGWVCNNGSLALQGILLHKAPPSAYQASSDAICQKRCGDGVGLL